MSETLPPTLGAHLCFAIYTANMAVQRTYKPVLDELGLTYPQYLVMITLWSQDGMSVGAIADTLSLESSTLTPLLQRLEQAGLVKRQRDPQSERRVIITLTDQGKALRAQAHRVTDRLVSASGWDIGALDRINDDIRRLRAALTQQAPGAA
ncbi:MarR family transcriptional regulator [Devosia sp. FKR38]|uniref:MarR family winged helix-turn-helix transcriptional regulator n=1 Tax=Devosia sp. FKR38 TaxID=2562312 RepID=UPI0010C0A0FE|nr:MarR family transcriptional regulator [Devosia sp. FKR38]